MKYISNYFILIVFLLSYNTTQSQTEYHVFPTNHPTTPGTSTGDGSESNPWDLQTALNSATNPNISGGDIIWLHGGTYTGRYTCNISGSENDGHITISSYPGEWAIIDGNIPVDNTYYCTLYNSNPGSLTQEQRAILAGTTLQVTGGYLKFKDFEVTFEGEFSREREYVDCDGDGESDGCPSTCTSGIQHNSGINCKFINLVIHDLPGNGTGSWNATGGAEIYGCLIYNNGNEIPTNPGQPDDGSGIYAQNSSPTLWKNFNNNIFFNNFKVGAKLYSDSNNLSGPDEVLQRLNFEDNVILNSGSPLNQTRGRECFIMGGKSTTEGRRRVHDVNVRRNFMAHRYYYDIEDHAEVFRIGQQLVASLEPYFGNYAYDINVEDNYFLGRKEGVRLIRVGENFNFKRNIVRSEYLFSRNNYHVPSGVNTVTGNWHFEENHYFTKWSNPTNSVEKFLIYGIPGGASTNFFLSELVTPLSENGLFEIETSNSTHNRHHQIFSWMENQNVKVISLVQNYYEPSRFKAVVFDGSSNDVTLNSNDLAEYNIPLGLLYTVRDAENYFEIINQSTYNGNILLDMGLTDLDTPDGDYPSRATITPKKSDPQIGVFIIDFIGCEFEYYLEGIETVEKTYRAQNQIVCAGNNDYVIYDTAINHIAGKTVILKPGFLAKSGSKYHARIESCDDSLEYFEVNNQNRIASNKKPKKEESSNNIVKVFPNPTSNSLTIKSEVSIAKWELKNQLNNLLMSKTINTKDTFETTFNLNNRINTGIYFLTIKLENGEVVTKQIIKE